MFNDDANIDIYTTFRFVNNQDFIKKSGCVTNTTAYIVPI